MNAPPNAIDMAGAVVPGFQVLEYAQPPAPGGARWWVMCLRCRGQQIERGSNLRRAQRVPAFRIWCKECGE